VATLPSVAQFLQRDDHTVTIFKEHTTNVTRLAEWLRETEALVLLRERTPVTAELIARLPRLRVITLNGPYPHVDVAACTRHRVLLCAGAAQPSYATAELTWGLVISAMRRIPQEMARLKAGLWQGAIGTGLRGRCLGVLGYGTIGKQVAAFGRAFGMRVLVWSREKGLAAARADGHEAAQSQDALFESADVVTLHVRLKPETRGIVTAAHLARMKPGSVLVNTSRAALIEPDALVNALRAGRPGAAAVDVYEHEPVIEGHPLLEMDNVVCTPHLGYVERDQLDRYYRGQLERVDAFARGTPNDVVNPEAFTTVHKDTAP
jgi:D-3-phosphoglycerate dehydrogenase